jgi:hypothetical protein
MPPRESMRLWWPCLNSPSNGAAAKTRRKHTVETQFVFWFSGTVYFIIPLTIFEAGEPA